MNTPTLSIVMPIYNHPEWVKVMVDSIRANDFEDWELWAVDDGSETEIVEALTDEFSNDPRIHYINRGDRQPKGAQTCRNMGLEMAQGKYIVFFDSDDKIFPFTLRNRINAIKEREDLDFMVFPSGVLLNEEFSVLNQFRAFGFQAFGDDIEAFARRMLPFIVWNNIYQTDSLRNAKITWDVNLLSLQDADFNTDALLKGLKYEYAVTEPDFAYRIDANPASISKKVFSKEHQKSTLYSIEKFYQKYQDRFGRRYDHALYQGVLVLYNSIMAAGLLPEFANGMVELVTKYSPFWGKVLKGQVVCTKCLQHVMPARLARQLPMCCYLVGFYARMYLKKRTIKYLYQQITNMKGEL